MRGKRFSRYYLIVSSEIYPECLVSFHFYHYRYLGDPIILLKSYQTALSRNELGANCYRGNLHAILRAKCLVWS